MTQSIEAIIAASVQKALAESMAEPRPTPTEPQKLTYSVKEWAAIISCSLPKAYDMTHIEGFPMVRVGNKRVILLEQAKQRFINNAGNTLAGR